ncbi:MAG: Holliday junction ATP-dependent DNA helicase RuvA [Candidatus Beckwithbacteria bacterium GW2011_GWB1_47_15]|uniref:Holliday junction branch migration complex subunit RuvA n=1 Tax=Candidatus Beckwithbacteria bacterium GW2011_GWB1_47_15 TaxID=1618371 RepID=A0A0G1U675_9BACT|nr:MAG: Holliday junction ATP-dependent DNA helicase holliday junction DNA helicase RuvA [Candidatus Beckwithbacteria bacterium GW2011_GWC1_49_16]AQS30651.1 hypothetical protein [uncultured bacterium]KKU35839.1 MAG: Holliday junction ATP-dependent DNA helicase RuvA [Candidatus Beckwithbacteria bacterium GW2011_GWA1_46_30]KKU61803.1 MAG: Holliday junction ATP-dependent DNA helicase RuvA [Candidatus Beckwithbacteria bacterium GW2011_GWB1_47_15]KKU72643.1 MAG: Holliday junction ATP-dependent DNA h
MIGKLTGKPETFTLDSILLSVRGVGYQVFVPQTTRNSLLKLNQASLFIYTHVREDTLDLYGFDSREALQLFKLVIAISGVGPKIAVKLMDKGVDRIQTAISQADVDFFTSVPRLGRKNAQKIIIELKPKLGDLTALDLTGESPQSQEALEALIGLGFTKREAVEALKQVASPKDSVETLVAKAIKSLGHQQ